MICTLDANAMIVWAARKAGDLDVARLDALFAEIGKARGRIIFPTPALAEFFVRATETTAAAWVAALQRKQSVKIAAFDTRCAIECAAIQRRAETVGGKRAHTKAGEAYQKIKIDRQIAAIALVNQSDLIVTADGNLRLVCIANGLKVRNLGELPVPDAARQLRIEDAREEPSPQAETASAARPATPPSPPAVA